jgi:hypothetical protein
MDKRAQERNRSRDRRAPVAAEHIDKLVQTQQVLKRACASTRRFLCDRQAVTDVDIGSHAIKAGTSIVMPICHSSTSRALVRRTCSIPSLPQ